MPGTEWEKNEDKIVMSAHSSVTCQRVWQGNRLPVRGNAKNEKIRWTKQTTRFWELYFWNENVIFSIQILFYPFPLRMVLKLLCLRKNVPGTSYRYRFRKTSKLAAFVSYTVLAFRKMKCKTIFTYTLFYKQRVYKQVTLRNKSVKEL